MMVEATQRKYPDWISLVYSGDRDVSPQQILQKVRDRFGINLDDSKVEFCFLYTRGMLEAKRYPCFTMLGQSLGSIIVALEALSIRTPHVFIDSMGYSFTLWVARILGSCQVAAYVHYPTISSDMLSRVSEGTSAHNNRTGVARSPILRSAKLLYYHAFAWMYGLAGRAASLVFVNSSWTREHVTHLWGCPQRTRTLYPPCNTSHLSSVPFSDLRVPGTFISIAQFRPEKDHALQIRALAKLKQDDKKGLLPPSRLVLIGSCRHEEDRQLVAGLRSLAEELAVDDSVEFQVNVTFEELRSWYSKGQFGMHTMWCEHFGIGIVELMASGVIVVAHNSGGPRMDIVCPQDGQPTGFLASSVEEYAQEMTKMLRLSPQEILQIQTAARERSQMFSDEHFQQGYLEGVADLFSSVKSHFKVE
jgi:alpha-1,2-mannosyltransferase